MKVERLLRSAVPGILLVIACIGAAGCEYMRPDVTVEAYVTFAAHAASNGLVIDKMEGGQDGVVKPSSTPRGPQWVLYSADAATAYLWIDGADTVVRSAAPQSVLIGTVDAYWDAQAIRLSFKAADDATFSTSVFKRIAGGNGPAALGQAADSTLDLRGTYQADVTDGTGATVGWLRVRFAHSWSAHRIYDGVLPATLNGPLAVAAAARLDAELTAVSRPAMDPYIGN